MPASLLPVVTFGLIDAMYLAQEKAYRDLYNRIVEAIRNGSYNKSEHAYDASASVKFSDLIKAATGLFSGQPQAFFDFMNGLARRQTRRRASVLNAD